MNEQMAVRKIRQASLFSSTFPVGTVVKYHQGAGGGIVGRIESRFLVNPNGVIIVKITGNPSPIDARYVSPLTKEELDGMQVARTERYPCPDCPCYIEVTITRQIDGTFDVQGTSSRCDVHEKALRTARELQEKTAKISALSKLADRWRENVMEIESDETGWRAKEIRETLLGNAQEIDDIIRGGERRQSHEAGEEQDRPGTPVVTDG